MELHARLVRSQLNFFKPFVANCSLEVTRKGQDKLGELMTAMHRREVYVREHDFGAFQGAWITPHDQRCLRAPWKMAAVSAALMPRDRDICRVKR